MIKGSYLSDKLEFRSNNITMMRFIAAVCVIACHAYYITRNEIDPVSRLNNGQCNLGGLAVIVFFFLSGLYVTKSLERDNNLKKFFWKRVRRIFPQVWIIYLFFIFVLGPVLTNLSIPDYFSNKGTWLFMLNFLLIPVHNLPGVFINAPYQTVNGSFWTMPVEFVCYIGLMIMFLSGSLIIKKFSYFKRTYIDIAAFVFLAAVTVVFTTNSALVSIGLIVRPVSAFFLGVLFYDFRDHIKLSPVLGLIFLMVWLALSKTFLFGLGIIFLFPYGFLSIALGMPQIKNLAYVFNCSYEMYLLGWPIQQVILHYIDGISPVWNFILTLPFDIAGGYLVFRLTEWLLSKLKNS
ncbi:MAG: acyltransferase [Lachnospiraceae bacterium]|jgi:peptidoglycan/LPS O-acetylase OafA/YrhL|nr:acyltransferase [Lachnospiraceae bacterium]MEE3460943.1 acyltransferase [Lachnospiraceae bacterium]